MPKVKNAGQPFIPTNKVLKARGKYDMFDVLKHILYILLIKTAVAIVQMRSLVWVIMRLKLFNFVFRKFYITDISLGKLN